MSLSRVSALRRVLRPRVSLQQALFSRPSCLSVFNPIWGNQRARFSNSKSQIPTASSSKAIGTISDTAVAPNEPVLNNENLAAPSTAPITCYDRSPVSLGMELITGYSEMIAPGTSLPCTKRVGLMKVLNQANPDQARFLGRGSNASPLQAIRDYQTLGVVNLKGGKDWDEWHYLSVSVRLEMSLLGAITFHSSKPGLEITRCFDANTVSDKGDVTALQDPSAKSRHILSGVLFETSMF